MRHDGRVPLPALVPIARKQKVRGSWSPLTDTWGGPRPDYRRHKLRQLRPAASLGRSGAIVATPRLVGLDPDRGNVANALINPIEL